MLLSIPYYYQSPLQSVSSTGTHSRICPVPTSSWYCKYLLMKGTKTKETPLSYSRPIIFLFFITFWQTVANLRLILYPKTIESRETDLRNSLLWIFFFSHRGPMTARRTVDFVLFFASSRPVNRPKISNIDIKIATIWLNDHQKKYIGTWKWEKSSFLITTHPPT